MYKDPKTVTSPSKQIKSEVEVIINTGENGFSVAKFLWKPMLNNQLSSLRLGVRYNGGKNTEFPNGYPSSRGQSVWMVLPENFIKEIMNSEKIKEILAKTNNL